MSAVTIDEAPDASVFESVRERAQPGAGPEPAASQLARLLAWRGDEPLARCTIAVAPDLHGAKGRSGLIGHYEALDPKVGAALLVHARARLASGRVARVLGPMNGNTWARYRLALPDPGVRRADWFPGEPRNPPDYPDHFEAAGFSVAARYESRIDADLADSEAPDAELVTRLAAHGITLESLDPARFEQELEALFRLSLEAFADNPYYSPIPFAPFRAAYDGLRSLVDPDLVLIARDAGTPGALAGFLFAYGDPGSGPKRRVIVKTVAVAPGRRGLGLGNAMLDRTRETARRKGFGSAIHALMHVDNFSVKMSARHGGEVFRRYALYGWSPGGQERT